MSLGIGSPHPRNEVRDAEGHLDGSLLGRIVS